MRYQFLLFLIVFLPLTSHSQEVSSILLESAIFMDGLVQGPDHALYCGGGWNRNSIHRITLAGDRSTWSSPLNGPIQPVFGEADTMYVTNWSGNSISTIAPDGTHELFATVPVSGEYKIGQMAFAGGYVYATALSANQSTV